MPGRDVTSPQRPAPPEQHHSTPDDSDVFSDDAAMRRAMIESSPDHIIILTRDGVIRSINRVLSDLEGTEVVGRHVLDFVPPAEREAVAASFQRVLTTGRLDVFENSYDNSDGTRLTFESRVAPILRNGAIVGMTVTAREVTEQKRIERALREAEQSHRALIENSPVGILSVAPSGTIISANSAFHELLSRPAESLHGERAFDHMHPDDRHDSQQRFADLINGVRDTCAAELRFHRTDGEYVWTRLSASTIHDDEGRLVRLVCVVEDVTERHHAEHRQRLLMRELDHRVRNNLAAIVTLSKQSIATARTFDEFESTFMGRVTAMARSHEALASSQWTDLDLMKAMEATLAPHVQDSPPRVHLAGPPVKLESRMVLPLCLAVHELATNAMRHGSLSTSAGRVALTWLQEHEVLHLFWRETGGPRICTPHQPGVGTQLIEGFVRFELHGALDVRYEPDGLACDVTVPLGEVID